MNFLLPALLHFPAFLGLTQRHSRFSACLLKPLRRASPKTHSILRSLTPCFLLLPVCSQLLLALPPRLPRLRSLVTCVWLCRPRPQQTAHPPPALEYPQPGAFLSVPHFRRRFLADLSLSRHPAKLGSLFEVPAKP